MTLLRLRGLLFWVTAGLAGLACGGRTDLLVDEGAGAAVIAPTVGDASSPEESSVTSNVALADAAAPLLPFQVGFSGVCMLQASGGVGCFEFPTRDVTSDYHVALEPVAGVEGATQLAGQDPYCARLSDGTVTCWSQLQKGPARPVAGLDRVIQVDYSDFGCAVRDDGSVWCWGSNEYNNLGLGNHCPQTNPDCDTRTHSAGPVVQLSGAVAVVVSNVHACARTGAGDVLCWGRVGYRDRPNYPVDRSTPISVPEAFGARALAVSDGETIATLDSAFVVFGHPSSGEGPDAPNTLREPRAVGEEVYGSAYETFCRKAPGRPVHCKGGMALTPTTTAGVYDYDVPGTEGATDVSVSSLTACARLSENELVCWGQYTIGPTRIHVE